MVVLVIIIFHMTTTVVVMKMMMLVGVGVAMVEKTVVVCVVFVFCMVGDGRTSGHAVATVVVVAMTDVFQTTAAGLDSDHTHGVLGRANNRKRCQVVGCNSLLDCVDGRSGTVLLTDLSLAAVRSIWADAHNRPDPHYGGWESELQVLCMPLVRLVVRADAGADDELCERLVAGAGGVERSGDDQGCVSGAGGRGRLRKGNLLICSSLNFREQPRTDRGAQSRRWPRRVTCAKPRTAHIAPMVKLCHRNGQTLSRKLCRERFQHLQNRLKGRTTRYVSTAHRIARA
eukprot:2772405-Rhodomonas_salina.2